MKRIILLIFSLAVSYMSFGQPIAGRSTGANTLTDPNLFVTRSFSLPRYIDTAQANSLYPTLDSCGKLIYTYSGNNIWKRSCSPKRWELIGGSSSTLLADNGVKLVGDTVQQGGSIIKFTYIEVPSHLRDGAPFTHIRYGNLPESQSIGGTVTPYPTALTYNPSTISIDRWYKQSNGDTSYFHYGGAMSMVTRHDFDSTSTIFNYLNKDMRLASQGVEALYQINPPRDSTRLRIGRDGQQASVFVAQHDWGQTWGYLLNVYSETGIPDMPISTYKANLDFQRNINNTRRYKITGNGVAQYLSAYKTYQTAINMSTYEAGDYVSKVMGFHAYGTMYRLLSTATKAKTLLVSTVDSSFGFVSEPQYAYTNDILNGYGFWMKGDSDRNHINGFLTVGGVLPTIANSNQGFRYRTYVTGKGRYTDSLISDGNIEGFIVQGQALQVGISPSIGTEAGVGFFRTDSMSRQQAVIFAQTSGTALTGRYIAIRIGGNYTEAQNPSTSTGQYIRFETGPSQANVSRINRNGNWTVGNTTAVLNYRLYKKMAIDGNLVVLDSVQVPNIKTAPADSTTYKLAAFDAAGNLYRIPWAYAGGGSITVPAANQVVVSDGTNLTGSATFTRTAATIYGYATNDVNFEAESGSDISGLQILATKSLFYSASNSTNTIQTILELRRQTGVASAGIGGSLDYMTEDDAGTLVRSNRMESSFTTATGGATTSRFSLLGRSAGTEQEILRIAGSGAVKWAAPYGTNTFTGTPAYLLAVDASGNMITTALGGSGTLTNLATGFGLSGGPITTTGTVLADTTVGVGLIAYPRYLKFKDSVNAIFTPMARTLTVGYGITGGGDLSANRSFVFDSATVFSKVWKTNGNSVTAGLQTGDFIGTNNLVAFRFRTNNVQRMYLDSARNQLIIGSPPIDANNSIIVNNITSGNYDGLAMYRLDNATATFYGTAGIQRAGAYNINTTASGISLTGLTGVYIGAAFTGPTAWLHIKAGTATAGQAPFKLTTGTLNTTAEAGALEYTTPQLMFTNGGLVRQEIFLGQQSRVSTQFDKTNTTLANITGLTANVAAGKTYRFEAILYTTSDVAGGVKVAIGGTATATNIIYEALTTDAGTITQGRGAALGTATGAVTAVTAAYIRITGTITVNAAGTLTCQFAENAATATSSVLVGSTFVVTEML